MIFAIVALAWLSVIVVVVAACRMAAIGERAAVPIPSADIRCRRIQEEVVHCDRRVHEGVVVWDDLPARAA
jgi:hypothetical protein